MLIDFASNNALTVNRFIDKVASGVTTSFKIGTAPVELYGSNLSARLDIWRLTKDPSASVSSLLGEFKFYGNRTDSGFEGLYYLSESRSAPAGTWKAKIK